VQQIVKEGYGFNYNNLLISFGLRPVESEMNGGKGLSVGDIDSKIDGEDRGKQDDAQKATTSAADEAIGFNTSAEKATGTAKREARRQVS
jgi:Mn-containing catalase